jgi:hypothetical protein
MREREREKRRIYLRMGRKLIYCYLSVSSSDNYMMHVKNICISTCNSTNSIREEKI